MAGLGEWVVRHIGGTLETSSEVTRLGVVCRTQQAAQSVARSLASSLDNLGAVYTTANMRLRVADVEVVFLSCMPLGVVRGHRFAEAWMDNGCHDMARAMSVLDDLRLCTIGEVTVAVPVV